MHVTAHDGNIVFYRGIFTNVVICLNEVIGLSMYLIALELIYDNF